MTYTINYFNNRSFDHDGTLAEAKAAADASIDIPQGRDICVQDKAGNTLAIRKWHGHAPVSEESDPSACLDWGDAGYFGPWDDSPEMVAECAREDAESIGRIMSNLRAGLRYGNYMDDVRYPMYRCSLWLSPDGRYIEYSHYGSSAVKATPEKLLWLITRIFKLRPAGFEQRYDAYDPRRSETRQRLNYADTAA